MGKPILLVASTTGYQTQLFVEAAARLGIELVLATDRCHVLEDPWGDHALAIRFEDPDQAAEIVSAQVRPGGIVALGDRPAEIAAAIAARLGLRYHPPEAVAACRNKFAAREKFQAAGLPVPEFFCIPLGTDPGPASLNAPYPCVLKPLGLSASRGVIRADNPAEFTVAFRRIAALLRRSEIAAARERAGEFIQVERFIPGAEFALEGILTAGRLQVLALFDKPDPLDGPFFEETIYVTPSRQPQRVRQAIFAAAEKSVAALGLWHGPIHAEMRVNGAGVWMLEVAARPIGGLCARVLPGLTDVILRHAAGDGVAGTAWPGAAGVMMIPIPRAGVLESVRGIEAALAVPFIEDCTITAKPGQTLTPLPEGNSYLGFLFARASQPEQAEQALRRAHAELAFDILEALPVWDPQLLARGGT